jgi:glucose/arabinose dehydrogenase
VRRPFPIAGVMLAAAVSTAACGVSDGSVPPTPTASAGATARTVASPAQTPPASAQPSAAPTPPGSARPFDAAAVSIDFEEVVDIPGEPVGVVPANDGSARLFVVEQEGRIWLVRGGARAEAPFLDMSGLVRAGGEQGLLGLAFHPAYPDDPRFFVYYTDRDGGHRVATVRVSSDPDRADPNTVEPILRMEDFAPNHNGGSLVFGPDGFLYVATGDGGGGGDPRGSGQSLTTYLGKILRLDVDNPSGSLAYGIPADNPFRDENGALPEIWATGLRNPWRTSFDRATGDFWIGDVGQGRYEEIDVVRAGTSGQNFGWNVTEGFTCFDGGEPCAPEGLVPPVTAYTHDFGCSVTGGFVYRGTTVPTLVGGYLFADYCSGITWAIDAAAQRIDEPRVVFESGRSISSFGEGEDGELYATDIGGSLLRVVPGG